MKKGEDEKFKDMDERIMPKRIILGKYVGKEN
jgi:hypothetical protein